MKTALTIAGSDSSGGAGIQADIKTMTCNGVFAMSAITALTAQNTTGVTAIMEVKPEFLKEEIKAVVTDIFPDAVKTGMVSSTPLIKVISDSIKEYGLKNLVVDPVMVATSGAKLISDEAIQKIKKSMDAATFACNYELKIIASDDVIFTDPITGADPAMVQQGTCHIDAAYGGQDYTAFTIMRNAGGKHYVLGKLWQKAVDVVEPEIIDLHSRFLCGKVYCEDNADKGYLAKDLKKKGIRAVSYSETQNKYYKIVTHLKGEWENVVFVEGTDEEYIDMICDFNEDAEHDDAPDSLASLIRQLKNKEMETVGYKSIFGGVY